MVGEESHTLDLKGSIPANRGSDRNLFISQPSLPFQLKKAGRCQRVYLKMPLAQSRGDEFSNSYTYANKFLTTYDVFYRHW
jgi:hypothetical protein